MAHSQLTKKMKQSIWLSTFIRDPLSHFLAIGMVLFALSFLLGGLAEDSSRVIRLLAGDVEGIKQLWTKTHFRPPTEAELDGLVASRIK